MKTWESIQQTIDYIEENLAQELALSELAAVAHLSPFYFQRLFKKLVGRPVMEYVKLRRLAKSCRLLTTTQQRIIDSALAVGFNSHAHYTKTFKAAYGITPESYRQLQPSLNQMLRPDLTITDIIFAENNAYVAADMVMTIRQQHLKQAEYYQGVVGKLLIGNNLPIGGATGINQADVLWQQFHQLKLKEPDLFIEGIEMGASFLRDPSLDPTKLSPEESFDYFAGGKVIQPLHPMLETWTIDPGDYIVCSFEAENTAEKKHEALAKALRYLLNTWLPNHQLITQPYSLEKYHLTTAATVSLEIWVAPLPKP